MPPDEGDGDGITCTRTLQTRCTPGCPWTPCVDSLQPGGAAHTSTHGDARVVTLRPCIALARTWNTGDTSSMLALPPASLARCVGRSSAAVAWLLSSSSSSSPSASTTMLPSSLKHADSGSPAAATVAMAALGVAAVLELPPATIESCTGATFSVGFVAASLRMRCQRK